jgi:hypothetical protein
MGFNPPVQEFPGLTITSYDLSGLDFNMTYYWRVNVSSEGDSSDWSDIWSFTTEDYPAQITASNSINFPSHSRRDEFNTNDYRIFGIPGNDNILLGNLLGGTSGEDWQAYWDNGQSSNYFVPYDGGSEFRCSTGRAFWLIHNGPIQINRTVASAPLNADNEAEIELHSGWNLITCPFPFDVNWGQVQTTNGVTQPLVTFTGSFNESSILQEDVGYYFDNRSSLSQLRIPYNSSLTKPVFKPTILWQVIITLKAGEIEDSFTRFGISEHAEKGLDDLDFRKPMPPGDLPYAYFSRPQWDEHPGIYATDLRPHITEIEHWDFQVFVPDKGAAQLSFSGIEDIPDIYEIYLIDNSRLIYKDLSQNSVYNFKPVLKLSDFEIVIGQEEKITSHLKTVVPMEYTLGENFPNPFNPTTTIPVVLPEEAEVILTIYNLLGQEVKKLFTGTLRLGKHFFIWDGTDNSGYRLSSGIYLCCLTIDTGERFVGKMVMLK